MPEKPLISIITVNLNDLEGLKRTMTSVFEQTWQEFEYIVIDGGSTDGSKEYLETHRDKIDFWVSEKDSGIYNAMNKGIKVATGEYFLFLNSGDILNCQTVLGRNIDALGHHDLIYFNLKVIDGEKNYIKRYPKKLSLSYFLRDTLPHPATFIKASLFSRIGFFDENYLIVSDWIFFLLAIFKYNCSYFKIEEVFSDFNLDGFSSMPENKELIQAEKKKIIEEHFKAILPEIIELEELKFFFKNLKSSRTIRLLVKLNFLKKM